MQYEFSTGSRLSIEYLTGTAVTMQDYAPGRSKQWNLIDQPKRDRAGSDYPVYYPSNPHRPR